MASPRSSVAFYISGHGFGHASRQIEIINAFGRRRPDVGIFLRTSVAPWLLARTVTVRSKWTICLAYGHRADRRAPPRRGGDHRGGGHFYATLDARRRAALLRRAA